MFLTYIPDEIESGATVVANMKAQVIHGGPIKTVIADFTPDPYEKTPEIVIQKLKIFTKVVVISAGCNRRTSTFAKIKYR